MNEETKKILQVLYNENIDIILKENGLFDEKDNDENIIIDKEVIIYYKIEKHLDGWNNS
jgi:hypothetical protein